MPLLTFCRTEKKYLLTAEQYGQFFDAVKMRLTPDEYGKSTVLSHYPDTSDFRIIRASLDAENYKEKLRVRSYGVPESRDGTVFFEIKKKYDGIVYKRRVGMTYGDAEKFIHSGVPPCDMQIARELAYSLRYYEMPQPKLLIMCEREAYFSRERADLRMTFDTGIRYEYAASLLSPRSEGKRLLSEGDVILEIKTGGGMPLWLTSVLDRLRIYPTSFSKCGAAYRDITDNRNFYTGETYYG